MTIEQTARYASVSPTVVSAAIKDRELNAVTTHPVNQGQWMVHQEEVDRWVATRSGRD